jgi:hypothetical protein
MGSSSQNKNSTTATTSSSSTPAQQRPGSWRHAIFKKVVSPSNVATPPSIGTPRGLPSSAAKTLFRPKRSQVINTKFFEHPCIST